MADAELRARLGSRGRDYVDRLFQWPVLIARYAEFLESVAERGRGVPGLF
jgi:glycosyltransferase involved in cell wall biosynthesis